jgi:hypothetical protein
VLDLAVDNEGNMWAVSKSTGLDRGNKVYQWDGSRWLYKDTDAVKVAVDGERVMFVKNDGMAVNLANQAIFPEQGISATDIEMGGGKTFILSSELDLNGFMVHELSDSGWSSLPGFGGESMCVL